MPRAWSLSCGRSSKSLSCPRTGLSNPPPTPARRLSQGWLPDQGHVEVRASPEAALGLVGKMRTQI